MQGTEILHKQGQNKQGLPLAGKLKLSLTAEKANKNISNSAVDNALLTLPIFLPMIIFYLLFDYILIKDIPNENFCAIQTRPDCLNILTVIG